MLSQKQVAQRLGVSEQSVRRWWGTGSFPRPMKVGSQNRWRVEVVEEWIRGREIAAQLEAKRKAGASS